MKLVKQPTPTTCGQACLAMALSMTLKQAIQLVGHDGITTSDEIVQALTTITGMYHNAKFGLPPNKGRYIVYHKEPGGKRGHWTFMEDGTLYDPACIKNLWDIEKYIEVKL